MLDGTCQPLMVVDNSLSISVFFSFLLPFSLSEAQKSPRSLFFLDPSPPFSPLFLPFFLVRSFSLRLVFSPFFSFSVATKPSETSRLFSPISIFLLPSLLQNFPKKPFFSSQRPLFSKNLSNFSFSTSAPPFSSHSALEKITFSFGTPQHIQFPHFPRWVAAFSLLHNSLPTKNPHGFKVGCNQPKKMA